MTMPVAPVYAAAALYDRAFGYRDYDREVDFLLDVFARRRDRRPASFLELAAGPARHALVMARRGVDAHALDNAPAMADYGRALARQAGVALTYHVADMISFSLARPVELAACMLCSATHILSDADFVSHLRHVADALADGGLYIIELPHPPELARGATTKDTWTIHSDEGSLDVEWIEHDADANGARIYDADVKLVDRPRDGGRTTIVDRTRQRQYPRAEVERLVRESGQFRVDGVFGALDEGVKLDAPKAWRMVVVFEKTPSPAMQRSESWKR